MEDRKSTFSPKFMSVANWHPASDKVMNSQGAKVQVSSEPAASFRDLWQGFLQDTSLHGCKNISRLPKRRVASCLWTVLVVLMACGLCFVVVELFLAYRKYPIKTVWSVRQEATIDFPAVSFCLPGRIDMRKLNKSSKMYDQILKRYSYFPLETFFETEREVEEFLNETNEYLSKMSMSEFIQMTSFAIEDVFLDVVIRGQILARDHLPSLFKAVPDFDKGCWVLNLDVKLSAFDEIVVIINTHSNHFPPNVFEGGVNIFFHEKEKTINAHNPYMVKPGSYANVLFTPTEHRYLPLPYHSFGDAGCIESDKVGFQNPLKLFPRYSKISCLEEHLTIKSAEKCKCIRSGFEKFFPNVSECSVLQMEVCLANEIDFTFKRILKENQFKSLGCLPECSYTTYNLFISEAHFPIQTTMPYLKSRNYTRSLEDGRENLVFLAFKIKEEAVSQIEHVPELPLLSVFGTLGGYMGLFLGASLLTVTECLETLLLSLLLLCSRVRAILICKTEK